MQEETTCFFFVPANNWSWHFTTKILIFGQHDYFEVSFDERNNCNILKYSSLTKNVLLLLWVHKLQVALKQVNLKEVV